MDELLDILEEILRLKDVRRTGWVLRGVVRPESVADHSWGTAALVLLLAPPEINRDRAVAMATVHDLAEVRVGDIPRRVAPAPEAISPEEKELLERAALADLVASPEVRGLWEEYSAGESPEATFVRDMNLLDMCLQAVIYERNRRYNPQENTEEFADYPGLQEFFETSRDRFTTQRGRELFREVEKRYRGIAGTAVL